MDRTDEFLAHYGVKGMKWGVRRTEKQLRFASDEAREAHSLKKRKAVELTNAELKRVNERLKLEQTYASLTKTPSKLERGQKILKDLLGLSKTMGEVQKALDSPAFKQIKETMNKKLADNTSTVPKTFKVTPESRAKTEERLRIGR